MFHVKHSGVFVCQFGFHRFLKLLPTDCGCGHACLADGGELSGKPCALGVLNGFDAGVQVLVQVVLLQGVQRQQGVLLLPQCFFLRVGL